MSINFFDTKCIDKSNRKLFGLCDDLPDNRAYLDEQNGSKWIAVVVNDYQYDVNFIAIDKCLKTLRIDGTQDKRCDGLLTHEKTVTFVELKEIGGFSTSWIKDGEQQLRTSIGYFEKIEEAKNYTVKKAYIANNEHPKARTSQAIRMEKFRNDTGYILRIENRIILE
ncbi:MAG TPA: hypothetical protein VHO90_18895 [Bacteroidales bacterium]|nr:hypothetical protein [Bacteroidales bacterium]